MNGGRRASNPQRGSVYDAIVLGSGAGGLTAALSLARDGHSVLVLEAAKAFGGMLNPFARKHFHFDVGIHYVGEFGEGQAMRELFDSLGLGDVKFREINPDAIDRYVFPGVEGVLCKGIDRWEERLAAQFPRERDAIHGFLGLMKAVEVLARLQKRAPSRAEMRQLASYPGDVVRSLFLPLGALLDRYFRDPHLKNVFAGPGGDIGLPPGRASAMISLMLLNHFLGGAYYPIGGSKAYRDAYLRELSRNGADMLRNQRVTGITPDAGGTFAVSTAAGERFRGRVVVSNIDASDTFSLIRGAQPYWFLRRRAKRARPSLGTVCVFLGVDLDLRRAGMTDTNIFHYASDDIDAAYRVVQEGAVADDPFYFMTSPTLKDPTGGKAPAGHHTLEILTMASAQPFEKWFGAHTMKRGEEYEAFKERLADRLLDSVERHYLPGLRKHVVVQEISTPATNVSFVNARAGGIYGPEMSPEQTMFRRFLPVTGIPGLYLAGSSVFGGGIAPCTMSGVIAADCARRRLRAVLPARVAVPRAASTAA